MRNKMIVTKKLSTKKKNQVLKLPDSLTEALAEETGIHIGDGSMNLYKKGRYGDYNYSGNAHDDFEFSLYVKKIMKQLYNLKPSYERVQKNTIMINYSRTNLILFKNKLGLPLGKKDNISLPDWILNNNTFSNACIRGIFATDGYLHFQKKYREKPYYPHLKITSKSKTLIEQISFFLKKENISNCIVTGKIKLPRRPNPIYNVFIYGKKNLKLFEEKIGFINQKHLDLYEKWKSAGRGI